MQSCMLAECRLQQAWQICFTVLHMMLGQNSGITVQYREKLPDQRHQHVQAHYDWPANTLYVLHPDS